MSTKTEARNELPGGGGAAGGRLDSNDQDRQHRGGLWVLVVALVAFAGLAAASRSRSSTARARTTPSRPCTWTRGSTRTSTARPDSCRPRTRSRSSRTTTLPPDLRAAVAHAPDPGRDRQRRLPPDLWAAVAQDLSEPAIDKDFQREANQAASRNAVAPAWLVPTSRWSRPDPGFRTRPTDPPGSAARPASESRRQRPAGRIPSAVSGSLRVGRATTIRMPPITRVRQSRPWRRPRRPARAWRSSGRSLSAGARTPVRRPPTAFDRHEVVFTRRSGDTVHLIARGRVALRVTTPLGTP